MLATIWKNTVSVKNMHMPDITLPIYYLRQIADQLMAMGVDVNAWLQRHELTEADLIDSQVRLRFNVFRDLVEDAIAVSCEPALGLLVGQRLLLNTHGVLGFAAMNSGSIRQFIELFERYTPVRTPMVYFTHQEQEDLLLLQLHESIPLDQIQRPVFEAIILGLKKVLESVTLGASHVRYAAFPFASLGQHMLATDLFKCEVRFDAGWAGFALPLNVVDVPLKMADPATFQDAARFCQKELDKLNSSAKLSAQVQRLMLETQGGFPSLTVTARLFHMTERTLHRRLIDEGTSYKAILESVRHRLATEHVKAGRLSFQEIAYRLGYADIANFRRAFKRWEGRSPSDYRDALDVNHARPTMRPDKHC
jgi:AraC-like DNA-binding protein